MNCSKKEIERLKAEIRVNTLEELEHSLRATGTNLSKVKDNFVLDRVSMECFVAQLDPPTPIDESEIQAYYESKGKTFDEPGIVWWREYRIPRSSQADDDEATEKLAKLSIELNQSDDEDVADVIQRFGNHPKLIYSSYNRAQAGSEMDVELGGRLFSIPLNQWSEVIEGPSTLCLIRVSSRDEPRRRPLEDVEEEVRQKLIEEQNLMRAQKLLRAVFARTRVTSEYKLPDLFP